MSKKFSKLHILGAFAVFGSALALTAFLSPSFLRTSLVADGSTCYQHDSGDYLYDNNLADMHGWIATDAGHCAGMATGDLMRADGEILPWGHWTRADYGGSDEYYEEPHHDDHYYEDEGYHDEYHYDDYDDGEYHYEDDEYNDKHHEDDPYHEYAEEDEEYYEDNHEDVYEYDHHDEYYEDDKKEFYEEEDEFLKHHDDASVVGPNYVEGDTSVVGPNYVEGDDSIIGPNYTENDDHDFDKAEKVNRDREERDMKREIKRAKRDLKSVERECKKNDCTVVSATLDQMKAHLAEMESSFEAKSYPEFWDKVSDFNFSHQDFWDGFSTISEAEDLKRWVRDIEREIKDRTRWIKDLKKGKNDVSDMEDVLKKMESTFEDAKTAMAAGNVDEARDIFEFDFDDLRYEFDDAAEDAEKNREEAFFKEDMGHMLKEIERTEKRLDEMEKRGEIVAADAAACRESIVKGKDLAKKVLAALDDGDVERADDLRFDLQNIGDDSRYVCPGLDVYRPDFDSFNDVYIDDDHQRVSKDILEKLSGDVVNMVLNKIQNNPAVFNDLVENGGFEFSDEISDMLENTSYIEDNTKHGELLSRKAKLLTQVKEMEKLTSELQRLKKIATQELRELEAIQDDIAGYNFVGDAGTEIEADLDSFISQVEDGSLSAEEVAEKIRELKSQADKAIADARKEKFASNLIPFMDADDSDWFTKFAAFTKDKGWVKGTGESNFTSVNPGAVTNVAEAVTMLGRVVGVDNSSRPGSSLTSKLPAWAHPGLAALERVGVDPAGVFGSKNGGDVVTRAEVAVLVRDVFNLSSGDTSSFTDLAGVDADKLSAIGAVNKAGIMTGEGGGTSFNPNGVLNRAALMKILTKAAELTEATAQ